MHELETALGYRFSGPGLLEAALTHRSLARDGAVVHNQRLEFLGDAVLGLMVADMLYGLYPDAKEGDLSRRLVSLVNGEQLAHIARAMGLQKHLVMSSSEEEQGGRTNDSNLEDACEALLGALYLDGGLDAVRPLIERHWKPLALAQKEAPKDAKTALQEWVQARGLALPEYVVKSAEGPAHAPDFVIEVRVADKRATGRAGSKRIAEREAAQALLSQLR
jgi:ribonuclease-3